MESVIMKANIKVLLTSTKSASLCKNINKDRQFLTDFELVQLSYQLEGNSKL
jgi:hypothetical protein